MPAERGDDGVESDGIGVEAKGEDTGNDAGGAKEVACSTVGMKEGVEGEEIGVEREGGHGGEEGFGGGWVAEEGEEV